MKKLTLLIAICTVVARLSGFLRMLVLTRIVGVGPIAEAFNYSNNIPNQWFTIISSALIIGMIPAYTSIESKQGEAKAMDFLNNIRTITMVLCLVISGLFLLGADFLIPILTGYQGETLALTIQFSRIVCLGVFSVALVQLHTGYLNLKESFIVPALISLPANVILIVFFILGRNHVIWMAWGNLISMIVQAIIMVGYSKVKGFKRSWIFKPFDPAVRMMVRSSLPIVFVAIYGQIGDMMVVKLTTSVNGATIMLYTTLIIGLIQAVAITSITSLIFPKLARLVSLNQVQGVTRTMQSALSYILLLALPATLGIMLMGHEVSTLILGMVSEDHEAIALLGNLLQFQAIALLANGLIDLLSKLFYAHKRTTIPMILNCVNVTLTVSFGYLLFSLGQGLQGIVLASALASLVVSLIFILISQKEYHLLQGRVMIALLVKVSLALGLMALCVVVLKPIVFARLEFSLAAVVTVLAGALVYGITGYLLRIPEIKQLVNSVLYRLRIWTHAS